MVRGIKECFTYLNDRKGNANELILNEMEPGLQKAIVGVLFHFRVKYVKTHIYSLNGFATHKSRTKPHHADYLEPETIRTPAPNPVCRKFHTRECANGVQLDVKQKFGVRFLVPGRSFSPFRFTYLHY